jgi:predicted amidohydrolase
MIYNAAQLVDAQGTRLANHRKRLPSPGSFEETAFARGETATFAELAGVRIAILICYEVELPETVRQAAMGGAQLVLVPTALGAGWGIVAETTVPARAFENGVCLAYADQAGYEGTLKFHGGSRVVGPDGRVIAAAPVGEAAFITARIEPAHVTAAQARLPYLRDCERI